MNTNIKNKFIAFFSEKYDSICLKEFGIAIAWSEDDDICIQINREVAFWELAKKFGYDPDEDYERIDFNMMSFMVPKKFIETSVMLHFHSDRSLP
jgi:hypothetical protein